MDILIKNLLDGDQAQAIVEVKKLRTDGCPPRRITIEAVEAAMDMPRMNGWETLKELRRMRADVPVILASGYNKESVMVGDHPELPQAFLNKPYSMAALKDASKEPMRF